MTIQKSLVWIQLQYTHLFSNIPQAIGMVFSRLISDNLLLMLYMARLFNLIVCVVLLYFTIKLIPFGKLLVI